MRFRIIGCAVAAALAVFPLVAQHADDTIRNPFTSADDVEAGGRLYRSHCAVCHGIEGEGGRGVALTTGRFRHGSSDRGLYNTISVGIPGTEMPGIFFNGRQMWQLVAFVRSLSEGKAAEQATGDPEKGSAVYAANGCSGCHRIRGEGGRMGPDLTDIGVRSMGHLQASVLNPNESVLPQHWMVRAKSSDGKPITGLRLNEDTFSVQLIDGSGSLLSVHKADLAEFEVDRTSGMPSFEGKIQGEDLDNLIAYLASLRLGDPNDASQ
ncbi:MAG: c-type cytochrome [Bryobacterales bacterium]|nr:c-type cytochrome [Bryobacterales bacterium]MDE0622302.1 c-type cytochrome [Bryobacterales bacterium]